MNTESRTGQHRSASALRTMLGFGLGVFLVGCVCEAEIHTVNATQIYVTGDGESDVDNIMNRSGISAASWLLVDSDDATLDVEATVETIGHYCDFDFYFPQAVWDGPAGEYRGILLVNELQWPLTEELRGRIETWQGQDAIITPFSL